MGLKLLCIVAEAKDIYALERTSAYNGRYHVLGGLISPMDGIGPAQLRIKELIERIASEGPHELVIATNPNAEGEATALYLSRLISPRSPTRCCSATSGSAPGYRRAIAAW